MSYGGVLYHQPDFVETPWVMHSTIVSHGNVVGKVSVYYIRERPPADEGPFLKEERRLIDAIADRIGRRVLYEKLKDVFDSHPSGPGSSPPWRSILDLLQSTDVSLFMRMSRKMLTLLSTTGDEEAGGLLARYHLMFAGAQQSLSPDANVPLRMRQETISPEFTDEIFRMAEKHYGNSDILGKIPVQANLMLNDRIWGAMSRAFESATGDLADRMLAALEAAEQAGGDIRGKQSAAILIVRGVSTGRPWADRLMELRIEDHDAPLVELRRLIRMHRAYDHMNRGDLAVEHGDVDGALREYSTAEAMFPDNLEMKFWHAVALVNVGRTSESLPLFEAVFKADSSWATLVLRLPASGTLTADETTINRILRAAPR